MERDGLVGAGTESVNSRANQPLDILLLADVSLHKKHSATQLPFDVFLVLLPFSGTS